MGVKPQQHSTHSTTQLTELVLSWMWMCTSAAEEEVNARQYASLSFSLCRKLAAREHF